MRRTRRETRVVGHPSVQEPVAREAEGGDEVDRVKRRHALGENELGLVEERLLESLLQEPAGVIGRPTCA